MPFKPVHFFEYIYKRLLELKSETKPLRIRAAYQRNCSARLVPDLVGLFLGWNGTTGIITKVAIKLFPKPSQHDVLVYMTDTIDDLTDIVYRITQIEMAEDINVAITPKPEWLNGFQLVIINVTANSDDEMKLKKTVIRNSLRMYYETKESGFMPIPPNMKFNFLEQPQKALTAFADVMKGGGFEYVGSIIPLEKLPEACRTGLAIAEKNRVTFSLGARIIGRGHCVMFFNAYAFNRADELSMERAARALEETNESALRIGGIPWKAEAPHKKNK